MLQQERHVGSHRGFVPCSIRLIVPRNLEEPLIELGDILVQAPLFAELVVVSRQGLEAHADGSALECFLDDGEG